MSERYGQYELLEKFAEGGAAEVFFARLRGHEGFTRELAIKRLLPGYGEREELVAMFLDEARLAASLLHPNIVQVFDLGEIDGSYFMAMELVDGPHLGRLFSHSLRIERPLSPQFCAWILSRAAEGLHYAHERLDPLTGESLAIVHRDISPHNILVSRYGDVKLSDFGIARATMHRSVTRIGVVKGKSGYLSPEQLRGEAFDRRADIFSLGIVLYELLTGQRLYREPSAARSRQRIIGEEPLPPSVLKSDVDPVLGDIALRALRKDPRHRYQTAAEFGDALQAWLGAQRVGDVRSALGYWMSQHSAPIWTTAEVRAQRWQAERTAKPSGFDRPQQRTRHGGSNDMAIADVGEESLGLRPRRTNLRRERGTFHGRDAQIAELDRLLEHGERLTTIVGVAGVGKSRLARRFGHRHIDRLGAVGGVWICDVAEHESTEGLCLAVASALAVPLVGGGVDPSQTQLAHAMAARGEMLLIIDNFDRMSPDGVDFLRTWLRAAPQLHIVVTSRARLATARADFVEVPPLTLPAAGAEPASGDAVRMFLERGRAALPEWQPDATELAVVAEIVRQLDGLPLALELAAARLAKLTPALLLERLSHRFEVLRASRSGDTPAHGATLRGAIDWSWTLLTAAERKALATLSVFRGGFDLAAAVDVLGPTAAGKAAGLVGALRDRSLLHVQPPQRVGEPPRFDMYRSIAAYAGEKLVDEERSAAELRHGQYYVDVGGAWADATHSHGGGEPLRLLSREIDNLAAVQERFLAARPRTGTGLNLARQAALAMAPVLHQRGPWSLLAALLGAAIAPQSRSADGRIETQARVAHAAVLRDLGRAAEARREAEAALALARGLTDERLEGRALLQLARVALFQEQKADAATFATMALELLRRQGDRRHAGLALQALGQIEIVGGDADEAALGHLEQAMQTLRAAGDRHAEAEVEGCIGGALADRGQLDAAEGHLLHALETVRQVGDRHGEGLALAHLGAIHALRGDPERAREGLEQAARHLASVGDGVLETRVLARLATVRWLQGRPVDAHHLAEQAVERAKAIGDRRLNAAVTGLNGALLSALGEGDAATAQLQLATGWLHDDDPPQVSALVQLYIALHELARAQEAQLQGSSATAKRRLLRARRRVEAALGPEMETALAELPDLDLRLAATLWQPALTEQGEDS